jgi:hypothetical protein
MSSRARGSIEKRYPLELPSTKAFKSENEKLRIHVALM